MTYRAHVSGFTGHFDNLNQLRAWVSDLKARFGLAGETIQIWKAVGAVLPTAAQYHSTPDREITL